jgi:hypothetical protein
LRDLLYLSSRKLSSFVTSGPGYGIAGAEVELRDPAVRARVSQAPARATPEDQRSLDARKLEKAIRNLGRTAACWAGPSVLPGDWVRFAVPMAYSVFSEPTGRHPVALFAGSARHPHGAEVSLLLCGDPARLLGSDPPADNYWAAQGRYLDHIYQVIREDNPAEEGVRLTGPNGAGARGELTHAFLAAQHATSRRSHTPLSGHARVLLTDDRARLTIGEREDREGRLVVATPLYVEQRRQGGAP